GDTIYLRGAASFADTVVDYNPLFGNGPEPDTLFADSLQALGAPDYAVDPVTLVATGAVSLGHGGQLTVEFTDNALTGSGDAA
ncbi:MAG: hypothetical protein KDA59_25895, partial [Planctomycetales bacterium]|nr:hypothetical protein [Planctomycetales bacterium]